VKNTQQTANSKQSKTGSESEVFPRIISLNQQLACRLKEQKGTGVIRQRKGDGVDRSTLFQKRGQVHLIWKV
jgi:hypothetical protein